MSRYLLSNNAFLCMRDEQLILLDLSSGKYMSLDVAQARPLGALVRDWPVRERSRSDSTASERENAIPLLRTMLDRGLLTEDPRLGKSAAPMIVAPPASALGYKPAYAQAAIRAHHVLTFCAACLFASASLRLGEIHHVVRRIGRLKTSCVRISAPLDMERVGELVAVFSRLRPFVFSTKDACLFHSLALMRFLLRYGVLPQCVFGVRTAPFAAHCWIQYDGMVLNDTLERVRSYTPILLI